MGGGGFGPGLGMGPGIGAGIGSVGPELSGGRGSMWTIASDDADVPEIMAIKISFKEICAIVSYQAYEAHLSVKSPKKVRDWSASPGSTV